MVPRVVLLIRYRAAGVFRDSDDVDGSGPPDAQELVDTLEHAVAFVDGERRRSGGEQRVEVEDDEKLAGDDGSECGRVAPSDFSEDRLELHVQSVGAVLRGCRECVGGLG